MSIGHAEYWMTSDEENELEDRLNINEYDAMVGEQEESMATKLKEAREFAEWMHELVDWQEGFVEIPWSN